MADSKYGVDAYGVNVYSAPYFGFVNVAGSVSVTFALSGAPLRIRQVRCDDMEALFTLLGTAETVFWGDVLWGEGTVENVEWSPGDGGSAIWVPIDDNDTDWA
jgi:hypothetical protein